MRKAVTPISDSASSDSTTRVKLFDWVSNILDEKALGGIGGALKLVRESDSDDVAMIDVRDWPVQAVAEGDLASVASLLADQIMREAEASCEGCGGGEMQFYVRAYKNGERSIYRERPVTISLEESRAKKQRAANHKDVLNMLSQQNLQLHQVITAQASQFPKIIDSLRKTIEDGRKLDADNFALLRANIENREGREAEAYAVFQRADMMKDVLGAIVQTAVPALIQHAVPHVMPMLTNWMSKPENEKMATGLINLIASSFAQQGQQQQQQPQFPLTPNNSNG